MIPGRMGGWLLTRQKKGCYTSLYGFFSCNTDIPKISYTTLYTVIWKRMTFLWLSYTNQIPSPKFTKLYTAFKNFLTNTEHIPISLTYTRLIPFLKNIDLSLVTWIVILFKKLHNVFYFRLYTSNVVIMLFFGKMYDTIKL